MEHQAGQENYTIKQRKMKSVKKRERYGKQSRERLMASSNEDGVRVPNRK